MCKSRKGRNKTTEIAKLEKEETRPLKKKITSTLANAVVTLVNFIPVVRYLRCRPYVIRWGRWEWGSGRVGAQVNVNQVTTRFCILDHATLCNVYSEQNSDENPTKAVQQRGRCFSQAR